MMRAADVRQHYRRITAPPHPYFDCANRTGSSPFAPGLPADAYDPFIVHFDERAQTARAQARRYARKHHPDAGRWERIAAAWTDAARLALRRKQRAIADASLTAIRVRLQLTGQLPLFHQEHRRCE